MGFQAVTGGHDWDTMFRPLRTQLGFLPAWCFLLYIVFALLAMMNVITGVFVESVVESAKRDKDLFMINNVREFFSEEVDGGIATGYVDEKTFRAKLDCPQMREF